ncbi:putative transporter 1 [Plasmodium gaboni]|uniref:Putative transporter 1 n=1 Tax=Plasmodium gaboni TaxID=647221 RepID=A0A151LWY1_9APIC|nr:putative transporter 1 [Plasmodium gaboni]KYO03694.1 putative transporter 1 [Plasmodium gaboni]
MKNSIFHKVIKGVKGLKLKTDPNLPGAKQKTPLNIKRFSLLIILIIYTATSACIYFDWSAIRNLLLHVGKYKHLNVDEYSDITLSPQYKRINALYPMTLAVHFTTSVFCGFLYDHIGPKFTAIIGQLFNIICWILLSIDTKVVDTTLWGFIFLGLGADTAFIPALTVSNLYPDASTFILTVIGAAASLSYAVPATLDLILKYFPNISFRYICYGYILLILVPCLLTAAFLLPLKPFKALDYYLEKNNETTKHTNGEGRSRSSNNNYTNEEDEFNFKNNTSGMIDKDSREKNVNTDAQNDDNDDNISSHDLENNIKINKNNNNNNNINNNNNYNNITKKNTKISDQSTVKKDKCIDSSKNILHDEEDFHKKSIFLFFKILISYPSVCVITYFILFNISTVFYGMVTDTYFSYDRSIINVINILMPLSSIPCVIFGRFINKYGAAVIILTINTLSVLMHLCALIKFRFAGLCSAFLYMCVTSVYTSQIYCFIQNSFPSVVFGKLLGFASLCGGVFSLLCENLYDLIITKDSSSIDPTNISLLIVIVFIIMFLPLSILYVRKYERSIENFGEKNKLPMNSQVNKNKHEF